METEGVHTPIFGSQKYVKKKKKKEWESLTTRHFSLILLAIISIGDADWGRNTSSQMVLERLKVRKVILG